MINFYKISNISPVPNAGLRGERRGDVPIGERIVRDIVPDNYSIDVWDSGRRWPDLMHSLDCMLWSERVVKAFDEAGLSGVAFFSQALRVVDSKALQKMPDPHYHWAHALAGVPAVPHDRDRSNSIPGTVFDPATIAPSEVWPFKVDPATGFYDLSKGGMRLWKFDFSQWEGADLFYVSTVHTRHRYCTQRFKDLVESHKFTNFRFTGALNPEGNWFFA